MKILVKNENFGQKMEVLLKNGSFAQKWKF